MVKIETENQIERTTQCDWEVIDIQMKINRIENKTELIGQGTSKWLRFKLKIHVKRKRNGLGRLLKTKTVKLIDNRTALVGQRNPIWLRLRLRDDLKKQRNLIGKL